MLVARLDDGHAAAETAWIPRRHCGQPPVLVARRTSCCITCRRRRRLISETAWSPEPSIQADGRVGAEPIDVLSLSETIVPAMISAAAPIVAGDQIVFLLGNYRGDIWMLDL